MELGDWQKASYSQPNGNCIEVARIGWRKSSYSSQPVTCVEVGRVPGGAAVRDSKDPDGGYFTTTPTQWSSFLAAVKNGRFDA